MSVPLHLNLGCGDRLIDEPGWLNIDCRKIRPESNCFKRLDIRKVREYVRDGTCLTVRLWDVVEHFCQPEARQLIEDCIKLLARNGRLQIKTPCIRLLKKWAADHDELNTALRWYGGQDYPQNVHLFVWPEDVLVDLVERLGLTIESVTEIEDTNIVIEAVKNVDHHAR